MSMGGHVEAQIAKVQIDAMVMANVEIHRGEQAEDQSKSYRKGQDPFKISHFFQTSFLFRM